jgi:hypothetical protein
MFRVIISLFLFFPVMGIAQLTDDFSDGDFISNPSWSGDAAEFKVNTSSQLQLNNTVAGASYLSVANSLSSLDNTEWQFFIRLNFSPSASNNAKVYLVSDQPDLEGLLNGYYLQFGEALSNDAVELFKQTGSSAVSIARGTAASIASSFAIRVKVTRDAAGLWQVFVDYSGGINFVAECSGTDNSINSSSWFGLSTAYTSSNSTKIYVDDVYCGPVIVDNTPPSVSGVTVTSAYQLDISFSEAVEQVSAETPGNYSVDNGIGNPVSAVRDAINPDLVHLSFSTLFSDGIINRLSVSGIKDFSGNIMPVEYHPFTYYSVISALWNDIIINEILFDPKTGGVDFLEIYNRSDKVIDLQNLVVCEQDTISGSLADMENIYSSSRFLLPGEYLVLTEDSQAVKSQYTKKDPGPFLILSTLPAMNIDGDVVVIADKSNKIIDKVIYNTDMHYPLLSETKGVSLERINYNRSSNDKTNWHSAAEDAGFATPGYKNSQFNDGSEDGNSVQVYPEIFSPDNDGENDVVNISYDLVLPGFVGNITVYDSKGRLVKNLVRNELLGSKGVFSWDGTDDERQKARIGIYIVYFEAFTGQGDLKKVKKTCVLAGKLN